MASEDSPNNTLTKVEATAMKKYK